MFLTVELARVCRLKLWSYVVGKKCCSCGVRVVRRVIVQEHDDRLDLINVQVSSKFGQIGGKVNLVCTFGK